MAVGDGVVVGEGVGDGVGEAEATTSGFAIFGDAEFEGFMTTRVAFQINLLPFLTQVYL